jgi:hypothetical protein
MTYLYGAATAATARDRSRNPAAYRNPRSAPIRPMLSWSSGFSGPRATHCQRLTRLRHFHTDTPSPRARPHHPNQPQTQPALKRTGTSECFATSPLTGSAFEA